MKKIVTFLFLLFMACLANAQFDLFAPRTFYKPFVSEISSTLSQVNIGATSCQFPNGLERTPTLMEVHLGTDIPVLYQELNTFKWALSAPVSLHVLWAAFEETTAPIVNNDYRFGMTFTGITYLNNNYVKNLSFKLTPFAHESTHLGDEVTLFGSQNYPGFYRINVSYEYYELGFTLNDPDTLKGNLLSFKAGFMGLLNHGKGYYSTSENEIYGNTVYNSRRWCEYYFQVNYQKTEGFLTTQSWHPSISIEARNRIKYAYESQAKEDRVWCINAYVGYNYRPKSNSIVKSVGHYFRYYNGINPHGQFRNSNYRFLGYAVVCFI